MGITEDEIEDSVSITCPTCGEEIRENRSVLESNGYVVCGTCGDTIVVSANNNNSGYSGFVL